MIYTAQIQRAIAFAIQTHSLDRDQKRKGKDIPYIVHPMGVGLILARAEATEDVIAAGILHDTIEDSIPEKKVTRDRLAEVFNGAVADLVSSVSETDKTLSWADRKREAIKHIATLSHDALLIKSADLISNVSELSEDFAKDGDKTFERFNAPKETLLLHYQIATQATLARWPENPLASDLQRLIIEIGFLGNSGKAPTHCILWNAPEIIEKPMKEQFELLDTYVHESHWWRYLLKCRECGQRYFFEFYEEIDWLNGNDPQYCTYVPVETDMQLELLKISTIFSIHCFSPRLLRDWPRDAKEYKIQWIGK